MIYIHFKSTFDPQSNIMKYIFTRYFPMKVTKKWYSFHTSLDWSPTKEKHFKCVRSNDHKHQNHLFHNMFCRIYCNQNYHKEEHTCSIWAWNLTSPKEVNVGTHSQIRNHARVERYDNIRTYYSQPLHNNFIVIRKIPFSYTSEYFENWTLPIYACFPDISHFFPSNELP